MSGSSKNVFERKYFIAINEQQRAFIEAALKAYEAKEFMTMEDDDVDELRILIDMTEDLKDNDEPRETVHDFTA